MDKGQERTEAILKKIEKRITEEYTQAEEEIEATLADYFRRFKKKDETWQKWVDNGTRTAKEYEQWRIGQMAVGERWENQREVIAKKLAEVNAEANAIARSYAPDIYLTNYTYTLDQVGQQINVSSSFTQYSQDAIKRILLDDPEIAPPAGKKVLQQIAEGKAVKWNKHQLQSVMVQGIMQGDSIPKLATRLATTVGDRDRKAAIRNARTMATGVQNAGRVDCYKRAEEKGVKLQQMWIATMDNRTRHSHRWLDGETRPVGEAFSNGCEYPADPKGDPAEIYNCRCTLRGVVDGLERRSGKNRDMSAVGGDSYDVWREGDSKSERITRQEEIAKSIKQDYINRYRGRGTKNTEKTPQNINGEMNRVEYIDPANYRSVADESNKVLDTYGLRDSKWSGVIKSNSKYSTNTGRITKNMDIEVSDKCCQGTIVHELLHSRSYAYSNPRDYIDFRNIEEATVQFMTEEVCKKENYAYAYTYQEMVDALRTIRSAIPEYKSDLKFGTDLINHDMTTRYGWLYNKVAENKRTDEVERAFSMLSGGDLGL